MAHSAIAVGSEAASASQPGASPAPATPPSDRAVTVREQAAATIRAAIVTGALLPGQRLTERELCAVTGAARTTVREAVRQLESEGLITTAPYRGPVVANLSEAEARDIYELRAMLEGQVGRLFVRRADDDHVADLLVRVEELSQAHDARNMVGVIRSSDDFYHVLIEGARNEALGQALVSLHNRLALFRFSSTSWPGRAAESMAEIRRFAAAVAGRDAEAAGDLLAHHIEAAAELALMVLAERARGAAALQRSTPIRARRSAL